jgi:hypothetical protein
LEEATTVALDHHRHLFLNLHGRGDVDPQLLEAIAAARSRLADAHLDLMDFGATGVARQSLRNARANREGTGLASPGPDPRPGSLSWAARAQ